MFRLSSGFKAGLRTLTLLATRSSTKPLPISEMASSLQLSDKYLEQLLMALRRAGLVRSIRGANGGFVLARSSSQISLKEIMEALQGPLEFCECQVPSCTECVRPEIWTALEACIGATLSSISLRHVVSQDPFRVMAHSVIAPDSPYWEKGEGI